VAKFIELTLRDGAKVKVVEEKIIAIDAYTGGTTRVYLSDGTTYIVPLVYTAIIDTKNLGVRI
jgi:hypothetical protein